MKRRAFIQWGALGGLSAGIHWPTQVLSASGLDQSTLKEDAKHTVIAGEYDVVVGGAGPAGVIAAIEAGRSGARVLLLEVHGCLGGVWTSGLLSWILDQANKPGIMRELEKRLDDMGAKCPIDTGKNLAYDVEKMKLLLEIMCKEANVDVMLHTRVVDVAKNSNKRLSHVVTESKSGRQAWKGSVFIDASGDGDLAALSGCSFDFGNDVDQRFQPMSLLALIGGVQFPEIKEYVRWAGDTGSGSKKRLLAEIVKGGVLPSYISPGIYPISDNLFMMMANHEYGFSSLDATAVSQATIQARLEVHKIVDSLKSLGGIWKDLTLVSTAEQIGVREGRRIHGLYTITKDDLANGVRHEDAICRATFGIDVHAVSKQEEDERKNYKEGIKVKPYDIPMRALIAKDVGGLLMAGRCISGDFLAHASYRVTGNAVAMGQAAGRLAAKAAKQNVLPQEVPFKSLGIEV